MVYPTRNKSLNVLHNYCHSINCFHLFLFLFFFHLHHKLCLCLYMVFKIMTLILEYFFHVLYVLLKKHRRYVYVYVFVVIIWQSVMSFYLWIFFIHSIIFINFQGWHSWDHMKKFFFVFVTCQYIACLKSFAKSNSTSIVLTHLFTHKKLSGTPLPTSQYSWNGILINFICMSKSSSENELFSPLQYLYLLGC